MKNFGILLTLLWSINLIAADAGWINNFDGNQDSYLIKRNNEVISTTVFKVLQVGDIISVNNKRHFIELYVNGGEKVVTVKQQNSPFTITESDKVPALSTELWVWMKERFNDWHKLTKSLTVSNSSKTLNMPLLSNTVETVALIAKDRTLYLQWDGGQMPYTVEVQKRLNSVTTKNSSSTMVKMDSIKLDANSSYRIKVLDSKGQSFMGGFKTVELTKMPVNKAVLNSKLPIEVRQTLQAIWLAKQNNGKWVFEAYQQIAPFNNYQPAKLLKDALANGKKSKQKYRGIRG
ncbi:hypothetical protein QUF74_11335 [Candidatus Halobeggiatoa sp. HSG11]|nr:hypothetical protein [Candidatus Halobeggiatoa sp. HSG11]